MASPPVLAVDPRRPGQYTLKIGKGLKNGSSTFAGVRFNHKPNLSNGSRTTKLSQGRDGAATISILDEEGGSSSSTYTYKGRQSTSKSSYVLIFNQETQSCTLEPVKSSYNFNLTSTPWETSQDKLSRQYEQLKMEESASQEFGDEDIDGEPDADNPYDFRHYLNPHSGPSASPSPALRPTGSSKMSDSVPARPISNTASATKTQSKSSTKADQSKQAARKQKGANAGGANDEQKPTPVVRLDRRAPTRPSDVPKKEASKSIRAASASKGKFKSDAFVHSSDEEEEEEDDSTPAVQNVRVDEGGGLEIDWGNEMPKKRAAPARVLDLPDSVQDGPISLHSAANSPAGRMAPRQQRKQKLDYEQDVIDFGASEGPDEDEGESPPHTTQDDTKDEDIHTDDVHADSDGDADVEPMELGSPAHHQQQIVQHQNQEVEGQEDEVDYDDDLEAQMMAAMEQDDEQIADEESDVSEAE
ncbi:uncharacterized protein PV09_00792 [Verruconis gallopava]|uniref:Transcription elongation factor Eaf N-terminal domain-containing protein n=1 Tax=Verruconis gallopava TaxID=253628 RepID=A0A0D2AQC3_9PEZI|nr:uncharacterized protein PV09_00792 [Verruconis gallopava]KIW08868.1 hypothetical protein PV09_00792 [Verruconis gallopava]